MPFYGFNRDSADVKVGVRMNCWRQGMMGDALAHYLGVAAFSETGFTADFKAITVPVFVMHGEDDQIVPIAISGNLSSKLIPGAEYKTYPGYPHGMPTVHRDRINADLLAFVRPETLTTRGTACSTHRFLVCAQRRLCAPRPDIDVDRSYPKVADIHVVDPRLKAGWGADSLAVT